MALCLRLGLGLWLGLGIVLLRLGLVFGLGLGIVAKYDDYQGAKTAYVFVWPPIPLISKYLVPGTQRSKI